MVPLSIMANQQGTNSTASSSTQPASAITMYRRRYKSALKILILLFVIQVIYAVVCKFELLQVPVLKKGYGTTLNSPSPRVYYNANVPAQNPLLNKSSVSSPSVTTSIRLKSPKMAPSSAPSSSHSDISLNISSTVTPDKERNRHNITGAERLDYIRDIFSTEWRPNTTFTDTFKNQLNAFVDTHSMFVMTQKTVKSGQAIHFSHNRDRNQVISDHLYKSFPKQSPFTDKTFARCSVVGSGGILRGSDCGAEIDKSDYIFRCNSPPVREFKKDAGSTTNITTLNPSAVWIRYHNLHSSSDRTKFIKAMQANNGAAILLPLFGIKSAYSTGRQITRVMNTAKKPPITTLIIHPKHFARIQDFWKERNLTQRLSTGFYLVSAAIALCDEVHLYGFWPFQQDLNRNNVTYHYYDETKLTSFVHDWPLEFSTLLELHRNGVIHLHVYPCNSNVGPVGGARTR